MARKENKQFLRRALGIFLLLATVGLATCQSVINSFAGGTASTASTGSPREG